MKVQVILKISLSIFIVIIIVLIVLGVFIMYNSMNFSYNLKKSYIKSDIQISVLSRKSHFYIDRIITDKIDLSILKKDFQSNEIFLDLYYKKPIEIVICRNDNESKKIFKLFNIREIRRLCRRTAKV